jgi:hypothetical protein
MTTTTLVQGLERTREDRAILELEGYRSERDRAIEPYVATRRFLFWEGERGLYGMLATAVRLCHCSMGERSAAQ